MLTRRCLNLYNSDSQTLYRHYLLSHPQLPYLTLQQSHVGCECPFYWGVCSHAQRSHVSLPYPFLFCFIMSPSALFHSILTYPALFLSSSRTGLIFLSCPHDLRWFVLLDFVLNLPSCAFLALFLSLPSRKRVRFSMPFSPYFKYRPFLSYLGMFFHTISWCLYWFIPACFRFYILFRINFILLSCNFQPCVFFFFFYSWSFSFRSSISYSVSAFVSFLPSSFFTLFLMVLLINYSISIFFESPFLCTYFHCISFSLYLVSFFNVPLLPLLLFRPDFSRVSSHNQ